MLAMEFCVKQWGGKSINTYIYDVFMLRRTYAWVLYVFTCIHMNVVVAVVVV